MLTNIVAIYKLFPLRCKWLKAERDRQRQWKSVCVIVHVTVISRKSVISLR